MRGRFDYIVIGAGSAGCAAAARLSEDRECRVLLLEAGPPPKSFWIDTPAGVGFLFQNKRFNWGFTSEPVETLGRRTVYFPRGKTLGGSSAVNGMVYMRGHPGDFDHWAELGNEGWAWKDVLPLFRKSEANERGADEHFGGEGPMRVSDPVVHHPSTEAFVAAAESIGIPRIEGLNRPPFEGVSYQQFTIRNGKRESSYKAFIEPARHRPNLTIQTGVHVLRIVVENGQATGVEIVQNRERHTIHAAREIILSAGVIGSPQILTLSGIGDGPRIRELGLDVHAHLPGIGRNLQDHWMAPFLYRVTAESSYNRRFYGLRKYLEGAAYLLTRRGYLALGSSAVSAYVRTSEAETQPDLQLALRPMTFNFLPDGRVVIDPEPGISGAAVLVGPRSAGHIDITSPDPMQAPAIHPNYLSHPDDIARLTYGIRLFRRIMDAEPMTSRIVNELAPGAAATTDEQLLEYMKRNGSTAWHPVGTCKMGSDEMAVVDARLRVRGVGRLRVADASIMPRITRGNTNAPAIMIGEKVAVMIREDRLDRRAVA